MAIIEIDHAPVNALARPVRAALLDAVLRADDDASVRAIIICGARGNFVAGAEIRELDSPPQQPVLVDVLARIESCNKPVVAALSGFALGGGLELALACHARCAAVDTQLGMPEIRLGLLPGAGGTQRLPRLIGSHAALALMLSGEPISGTRAHELGLVDVLCTSQDVRRAAMQCAQALIATGVPVRRLRDAPPPTKLPASTIASLLQNNAKGNKGLCSPSRIIECVDAASQLPFAEGIVLSRRLFEECRDSESSRALRHLFFAERAVGRVDAKPRPVERVAVIGAGTMGVGIAISHADAGIPVVLIDSDSASLERGRDRFAAHYASQVQRGRCSESVAAQRIALAEFGGAISAAASCDLVIEAVFENLKIKQQVFAALDACLPANTLLASNTSYLDINRLAEATRRPGSVLGLHFFSPANVMKLVEVVRGNATEMEALATAAALARKLRKLPVVVGNKVGFVGNRMLQAYGRESQMLLLEGASPAQVDTALEAWGMAMGPCAVFDLAGLDVGYRARRERSDLPKDPTYFCIADRLVERARLGQKSGAGHYRYAERGARQADPEVQAIIQAEAARLGVARRSISDEEIVERCVFALILEGQALLAEGVASAAGDIDVVWVNGYGFPRYRGGPMWYAATLGAERVKSTVERLARERRARRPPEPA